MIVYAAINLHYVIQPADGIIGDTGGCILDLILNPLILLVYRCDFFFCRIWNRGVEYFDVQSLCDSYRLIICQIRTVQIYMHGIAPFLVEYKDVLYGFITVNIVSLTGKNIYAHSLDIDCLDKAVLVKRSMERIVLRLRYLIKLGCVVRDDRHASSCFLVVPFAFVWPFFLIDISLRNVTRCDLDLMCFFFRRVNSKRIGKFIPFLRELCTEELPCCVNRDSQTCDQRGRRGDRHPCLSFSFTDCAGTALVCEPEIPVCVVDLLLD